MTLHRQPARGQILIIVAAGMVVLLGIGALAVDLGFGWMLRRQAQNAADPAAIAAARWIDDATGSTNAGRRAKANEAACFYAHQNGYFGGPSSVAPCVPTNDPHSSTLAVNFPPKASAGQWAGANGMVQVVITSQQETFFGRIFGTDLLVVSEQAVAARQRGNTNSHSLIALNPTDCNTGNVHGTGSVKIYAAPGYTGDGGYAQVNSDCGSGNAGDNTCGPGTGALKIDGTATLAAPKINVHGSCQSGSGPVGVLDEGAAQIGDPLAGLVPPPINPSVDGAKCGVTSLTTLADDENRQRCGSGISWAFSPDTDCPGMTATFKCVVLSPGVYYGGWEIGTKLHVRLNPGIYTMAGGGIEIKASGELDSIQAPGGSPAPVLIVNTDNPLAVTCPANNDPGCQGDLALGTASSKLKIAGLLPAQPCPPVTSTGGCPFGRMVIWHVADGSQGYDGLIDIEGGGGLLISGTIYAPTATVDIEGKAGTNCGTGAETQKASVQVIAWEWRIGGTGDLCMPYDPSLLYKLTQQGLVH